MNIQTSQFGPLEYEADALLHFPEGILGFEQLKHFLLIDQDEIAPLRWLQPIEEPALAFTVIDPLLVWPDYRVRVAAEERSQLQLAAGEPPLVLALVTVPSDPTDMTANLLGPLVLNAEARRGLQVVQHDTSYGTRQRLIPAGDAVSV